MKKRHMSMLRNLFEAAEVEGFAEISKPLLVHYIFEQERLTKNVFDQLKKFIPEDSEPEDFIICDWGGKIHILNFQTMSIGTTASKNWPRHPSKTLAWTKR